MTHTCRCCAAVPDGTTLCPRCVRTLDVALVNVAAHHLDLGTLRTKRTRYGSSVATKGSIGKAQPLGADLRFVAPSDAKGDDVDQIPGREGAGTTLDRTVRATLLLWVARAAAAWPNLTQPRGTVTAQCAWLGGILTAIAGQDWAAALLDDMLKLERALARLVDRPPERLYLGICPPCGDSVYALNGESTGKCRGCGLQYDTQASQQALRDALDDQLLTAAEIATIATYLDVPAPRDRVRNRVNQWHKRGRITAASADEAGNPRFRYRDVVALLYTEFTQADTPHDRGA